MSHSSHHLSSGWPGQSMNWNKIHKNVIFLHDWLTLPALGLLWRGRAKSTHLAPASAYKILKGISNLLWTRSSILLVVRPNSCLFSSGWKQSERSSNLSVQYLGNDNRAPLDEGSFCCLSSVFHKLSIPISWPIVYEYLLCVVSLDSIALSLPPLHLSTLFSFRLSPLLSISVFFLPQ